MSFSTLLYDLDVLYIRFNGDWSVFSNLKFETTTQKTVLQLVFTIIFYSLGKLEAFNYSKSVANKQNKKHNFDKFTLAEW